MKNVKEDYRHILTHRNVLTQEFFYEFENIKCLAALPMSDVSALHSGLAVSCHTLCQTKSGNLECEITSPHLDDMQKIQKKCLSAHVHLPN